MRGYHGVMLKKIGVVIFWACLMLGGFVIGRVMPSPSDEGSKPTPAGEARYQAKAIGHALDYWQDQGEQVQAKEVVAIREGDGFTIRADGRELVLIHQGGDWGRDNWQILGDESPSD